MKAYLYKMQCLTNLHVGSGDANYSIIDNEVEKDAVLGSPIIHSTGLKGALRDHVKENKLQEEEILFGSAATKNAGAKPGICKFLDAQLLSRPMRCYIEKNARYNAAFIPVTTPAQINQFVHLINSFACVPEDLEGLRMIGDEDLTFPENTNFLCTDSGIRVEDEETAKIDENNLKADLRKPLEALLGKHFAIAHSLDDFPLPVVARNRLGTSKNLWYEEYVPHHSVFYMIALLPEQICGDTENKIKDMAWLNNKDIVQFGGNASVGCGYVKIMRWGGFDK